MAPARVRGCAGALAPREAAARQADASRRRNGPRKATSRRPITVRLRSKSCPAGGPDGRRPGRRGVVAAPLRDPQQADVGSKTRSAGRVLVAGRQWHPHERRITSWTSSSRVVTPRSPTGSAQHVADKLAKIEKLDSKVISVDVECSKERNPRLADQRERIELTILSRGPVMRAEAAAAGLLRRARRGRDQARGAAAQGAGPAPGAPRREDAGLGRDGHGRRRRRRRRATTPPARTEEATPRRCRTTTARCSSARRSTTATPMHLDQALYEMELVGHDFYLFVDADHRAAERRLPPARPTTTGSSGSPSEARPRGGHRGRFARIAVVPGADVRGCARAGRPGPARPAEAVREV